MIENTDAQADLHPALVSPRHQAVIEVARRHGAIGWKVNGAGGDGGSVTLLGGPNAAANREMLRAVLADVPGTQNIPVYLSANGVRVWESAPRRESPMLACISPDGESACCVASSELSVNGREALPARHFHSAAGAGRVQSAQETNLRRRENHDQ